MWPRFIIRTYQARFHMIIECVCVAHKHWLFVPTLAFREYYRNYWLEKYIFTCFASC